LKIKQDLHARRESEKRKSEDRDSTPVATPSNSFIPPPLPPNRPTRLDAGMSGLSEDSGMSSHYGQQDKIALYARPHSAMNFRTSLNSSSTAKPIPPPIEKAEEDGSEESVGLTSDNTTSGGESSSRDLSEEIKAHRRATSISSDAADHVPIHTPV